MRRRVSGLVVVTTATVIISFVVPLCLLVRTLAEDRALAAADQESRNTALLVAGLAEDPQLPALVAALDERSVPDTVVLTADGRVLGSDEAVQEIREVAGGGAALAADRDVARARGGEAFTRTTGDGVRMLLPVVVGDGTAVVLTQVADEDLRRGVVPAWLGIGALGVVLLGLALLVADRSARRISEPLRAVAETAHQLREGDLGARAPVRGTEETEELARALNGLAERTTELLAAERAVVADLSHRLRTPVTALRLDADAVGDAELRGRLGEHVAVLQRTVDAIVREARRPVRTDLAARCDAADVVAARGRFWRPLAEDQRRPMRVDLPESGAVIVPVAADDLGDLLDVLVDNVFAHTPEGIALRIALSVAAGAEGDRALLVVADEGPGPASADAGEREGSTGLGLDIARRTADSANGDLRVLDAAPGTRVEVRLPLRG